MKRIFQGVIIAVLLVQIGCRSTRDEATGTDDGMPIGVSDADPAGAKPKKTRSLFRRNDKPEVDEPVDELLVVDGVEEPFEGSGEENLAPGESTEVLDSAALRRAKQHYELGDYDFAGEELRSIPKRSASYEEAQRLLQKLQQ